MSLKPWPIIKEEVLLKTPVFNVCHRFGLSPLDGQEKPFVYLDCPPWVQVLAVTENAEVVLVRQYRHGSGEFSLELPGGVVEKGQSPLAAAQRELREETGYGAEKWQSLAQFLPNPAVQGNVAHLFLAEGAAVVGATDFDPDEDIELELVPLTDLPKLVKDGTINHAIMVAGILFYLFLHKN